MGPGGDNTEEDLSRTGDGEQYEVGLGVRSRSKQSQDLKSCEREKDPEGESTRRKVEVNDRFFERVMSKTCRLKFNSGGVLLLTTTLHPLSSLMI